MKYDPYEIYAKDGVAHCELCTAFPPNAYGDAYSDGTKFVCRAIGWEVHSKSKPCGMFEIDERIKAKLEEVWK